MEDKNNQEAHLQELEERLLHPAVRHSAETVDNLLADNFIEFGSSGRIYNKQQVIESLQQESPTRRELADFKALVLAEGVVVVTFRVVEEGERPIHSLRSSIWKWMDGRWQMVFHQGTLTDVRK
jgi:hypothetical protein